MPTHNKLQEKASFKEGGTRRDKIMSYVVVFFLFGKDCNPRFTNQYTTGYLQYLCASLNILTGLFIAML